MSQPEIKPNYAMLSSENNIEKKVLVSLKIQEIGSPFQENRRFGGFPGECGRLNMYGFVVFIKTFLGINVKG